MEEGLCAKTQTEKEKRREEKEIEKLVGLGFSLGLWSLGCYATAPSPFFPGPDFLGRGRMGVVSLTQMEAAFPSLSTQPCLLCPEVEAGDRGEGLWSQSACPRPTASEAEGGEQQTQG